MAYSYDGINWTGFGITIFSNRGYGVAWNGSMWVATGDVEINSISVESPHPYVNTYIQTFELSTPGATSITIIFDSQTKTERNFDYLRFIRTRRMQPSLQNITE